MDLINAWQEIQQEKFNSIIINKEEIMKTIHMDSNTTIGQLKTRLMYKRNWTLIFLAAFIIWGLFNLNNGLILGMIGVLVVFYGAGSLMIHNYLRQMDDELELSGETLSIMKWNYKLIAGALKFEKVWAIVSMPIIMIVAVIISQAYKGMALADMLQNSTLLITLIICIVVLVPLGYLMTNKMNQYGFGGLVEQLKKNIHQMEIVE